MSEAVVVALISGLLTFAGTALVVWQSSRKTVKNYEIRQAVIEEKITNLRESFTSLTSEVRKHNGFAEKIPVLEERIKNLEKGG